MDPHGVHIFDEANSDHLVFGVPHHLKFQLFPSQHRFLDKHLVDQAYRKATGGHRPQLFHIVYQPPAGAAHGVSRANHNRISELLGNGFGVLDRVDGLAFGHFDVQTNHGLLESEPVLSALDRVHVNPDDLHAVFFQHSCVIEFRGQIQSGLSPQVRQQGVRSLTGDDFRKCPCIQGLDVRHICHPGIGHDSGRIGVDQNDAVTERSQGFAGLSAGIIELAGLTDDDRSRTDDQNLFDVCSFGHERSFQV